MNSTILISISSKINYSSTKKRKKYKKFYNNIWDNQKLKPK